MNTINKILLLLLLAPLAHATVVTEQVSYEHDGVTMQGMIAWDDAIEGKRPGILVVHEWWGHNDYARKRARMLAEAGYTALAVDMYGDGKTAEHPDDAGKFAGAVGGNLPLARARFEAAHAVLKQHPTVSSDKTAAVGYCFGGGMVLQMARMGVDIDAVVSYHGSLASQIKAEKGKVKAAVRVFHGNDDPLIKPEHVTAIQQEMPAAGVDFEFIGYDGATHAFTNPGATAKGKQFGLPLAYDAEADKDSWARTLAFFKELF